MPEVLALLCSFKCHVPTVSLTAGHNYLTILGAKYNVQLQLTLMGAVCSLSYTCCWKCTSWPTALKKEKIPFLNTKGSHFRYFHWVKKKKEYYNTVITGSINCYIKTKQQQNIWTPNNQWWVTVIYKTNQGICMDRI